MNTWTLYVSGINYGQLERSQSGFRLSLLDIHTAAYKSWQGLDAETCRYLQGLTHIDFAHLGARLHACQTALNIGKSQFTLADGCRYQKKDANHYIQRDVKFPLDLIVSDGEIVGVQTPGREGTTVLVDPNYKNLTVIHAWEKYFEPHIHPIADVKTVFIPMRDGVRLATDIWLPADVKEPVSCILVRTPYGRDLDAVTFLRYVQRGFALAVQDVRGRNDSEGDWLPEYSETEDGSDTLDYLADQDWCSGRIGMIGGSYLGYVQWAAAASGNPHLKAMVSQVCSGSAFIDIPRRGGTLISGMLAWAFAVSQRKMDAAKMVRDDWDEVLAYRPLADVCKHALGYPVPFWTEWLSHDHDDAFWYRGDWYQRALDNGGVDVPTLIMSGWFDDNGMGTTQALDLTKEAKPGRRKVILGPWKHSGNADYDIHGVYMGDNAIRYDLDLQYFLWFQRYLEGIENGIDRTAPVEYFTLGQNQWKQSQQWPPEQTQPLTLYLSGKDANTRLGHGTLTFEKEAAAVKDTLIYDPKNPAVNIIDMSENELEVPEDYTEQEKQTDYLVYTSEPLKEDIIMTGDAKVRLYVQSDVPDTDIVVRLTRVDEDGTSIKLADGLFNMKFVEGFDHKVYMEKDRVYPITIRTTKLSAVFAKGQRIRLTVTSSAVNFIFPNPNTKEGFSSMKTQIAHNSLWHGGSYAARIEFPAEKD
ncbi:CocE/NonD family hydrolase [Catenisphaera adipataccumulans]|jgi:putative CocE/NonD family hydrolase|uniref:Xaa-Pro dipeptidyl-peptidase C-terminal domain-containing protein n=1 Tax=Catenisphaera adipataccumulans TaxID=700500 RepID=A0A7W8FXU6_9FIRM|nr:CocE/NonD family hydrolase [Catenisphaera adipataccumulans]MBB5183337.1 hypothetical protein [Catenisphaera adipataccumulans]